MKDSKRVVSLRLPFTILQSGNDKYDAKRAEQLASDKPRAYIRFEEISKDQPDNAAEAISTPVSRSSASSDSRDPTEFDGQVSVI